MISDISLIDEGFKFITDWISSIIKDGKKYFTVINWINIMLISDPNFDHTKSTQRSFIAWQSTFYYE